MYKNFLSMSANVNISKIKFIVCGDGFDKEKMKLEAKKYPVEKFKFLGFSENIKTILENLDVFGYPLNPNHYGSGEQAINEAMYAGLPVVAFSNPAEQEIITHNDTGILVDDEQSYVDAIKDLHSNPAERSRLGKNAHKHIIEKLNTLQCFQKLELVYKEIMDLNKKSRTFNTTIKNSNASKSDLGARLFIESLGIQGKEFFQSYKRSGEKTNNDINEIIKEAEIGMKVVTKGSIFQYLYFFPNDALLNFWVGLISLADKNVLKYRHASIPKTTKECFEKAASIDKKNNEFQFYLKKCS